MSNLFGKLLIKHKVWAGYGVLVAILVLVAISAYSSLGSAQGRVRDIVEHKQPAAFDAMAAVTRIESASAALGYFLLTQGEDYRQAYLQSIDDVDGLLTELAANPLIAGNDELRTQLEQAASDFAIYRGYRDRMFELAGDFAKNMPAVQMAGESLNPLARAMLQYLGEMILAEDEQEASEGRRELLQKMNDLRYTLSNLIAEMRAYTAFRSPIQLQNMDLQADQVQSLIEALDARSDDLSFEQAASFDQFKAVFPEFRRNLKAMVELHGSDRYRTDAYLVRTEIGPLIARIQDDLYFIAGSLRQQMESSSGALLAQVAGTQRLVAVFVLAGIVAGLFGGWLTARSIVAPLNRAVEAMRDIAQGEGDLTRRLDVKGRDEIAQLAGAFNTFVDKIQDVVARVAGSVAQLAAAAEQMSAVTAETRQGTERQQSETTQVATAINEMNATAQEVARSAALKIPSATSSTKI